MPNTSLPPSPCCLLCDRPLEKTGGRRLALYLFREQDRAKRAKIKALSDSGFQAWRCQRCANMVCRKCGSPMQRPMGNNCLCDDGYAYHIAIYPVSPGCMNPDCEHHMQATA